MKSKLFVLVLVVVLTALAATPIAASPFHSASLRDFVFAPCSPGAAYNPTCDVNQDGAVNVLDIQLAAGHWNQTGTFTSDNNHNHLGQTWTGSNNPLTIQGAFGAPSYAVMTLNNSVGHGLAISSVAIDGIYVGTAGYYGMVVNAAGQDGVYVGAAGSPSSNPASTASNGFEIAGAQGDGLYVGRADHYGVTVNSAAEEGVFVASAGLDGVYANTSAIWGFYTPDAIHGSNVLLHSLSLVAQVSGPDSLTPGNVVAVAGITDPVPGSTVQTPLVRLAGGTFSNVVGVVESHLALTQQPSHTQTAEGETPIETPPSALRSVEGPAQAGDYVAITVFGAAQVKVDSSTPIQAGQRLTIAANGRVRPLGTMKVQLAGGEGTADIAESAPVIGVALEPAKDGRVWVLVNPQ